MTKVKAKLRRNLGGFYHMGKIRAEFFPESGVQPLAALSGSPHYPWSGGTMQRTDVRSRGVGAGLCPDPLPLLDAGYAPEAIAALFKAQRRLESRREEHARDAETRQRRAIAARVARFGRKVRCAECGERVRVRTSGAARLRSLACGHCGGRLRPLNWRGFDAPHR